MKKRVLIVRIIVFGVLIVGLSSLTLKLGKEKFVQVDSKLFASRYEVTNIEFREFLNSIKETDKNLAAKYLYDSVQWLKKFPHAFNEPLVNFYHWHEAYNNYPAVNITKETAEAYCQWLTNNYDQSFRKKFKKVLFRLPTEAEWAKMAGETTTAGAPDNKLAMANIKAHSEGSVKANYNSDGFIYTSKVGEYKPNNLGIYDVIGNAYELTQSGTQKGGSWDSFIEECSIENTQKLSLPDPRVGFRVVMEVIEE